MEGNVVSGDSVLVQLGLPGLAVVLGALLLGQVLRDDRTVSLVGGELGVNLLLVLGFDGLDAELLLALDWVSRRWPRLLWVISRTSSFCCLESMVNVYEVGRIW
jgi:hypothetical protein